MANARPANSLRRPVADLLSVAIEHGIRIFDTAPAYGASERLLGQFLAGLAPRERDRLTIATKCGETWDPATGSRITHGPERLAESVAESVANLGRIDLLQLHQASVDALRDDSILETLQALRDHHGIPHLGASVKTTEACQQALAAGVFTYLQMPINCSAAELTAWATQHNAAISIIGNRPFGSGRLIEDRRLALQSAATAVGRGGVVLTGTISPNHLRDNVAQWSSITA